MKKIIFDVDSVLQGVSIVCGSAAEKSTMPILCDIIIKCKGNICDFVSSDGEQWVSVTCDKVMCEDEFHAAVNAKDFLSAMKNLSGQTVRLEADGETHQMAIVYDNGSFSIPMDNIEDFPSVTYDSEKLFTTTVPVSSLITAIQFTKGCATPNILRPIMYGIHIDFMPDKLIGVALDMCKMSKYENLDIKSEGDAGHGVTIPFKAATALTALAGKKEGDIRVSFEEKCVIFSSDTFSLFARLHEGKYPPYDQLLRFPTTYMASVIRCELADAIRRITAAGCTEGGAVTLAFDENGITATSENVGFSKSAKERIACEYNGDAFSVNVDGRIMYSLLSSITADNVRLEMSGQAHPVIITPAYNEEHQEQYTSLIMPMQ